MAAEDETLDIARDLTEGGSTPTSMMLPVDVLKYLILFPSTDDKEYWQTFIGNVGYTVGLRIMERHAFQVSQSTKCAEEVDKIKILVTEFWKRLFGKIVGRLKRREEGRERLYTIYLYDFDFFKNLFKDPPNQDSARRKRANDWDGTVETMYICGLVRGALASLSVHSRVNITFEGRSGSIMCKIHIAVPVQRGL
eukprot:CAMPEP_0168517426 /NCGR_PEP_ID=MMETSP0405-20121227/6029_1 /TAXON_ID=498012 /ORGANISM="Trichosphaerium sp, Strain Am-I-7 wt" /LENGTH=194 /DNA_ID=CAMNT_0008537403 /DNA_START=19 /DNA_END=600 /DNA_ORIENTATION=-